MAAHKTRVVSAANTLIPAYLTLVGKGYRVSRVDVGEHEETWQARKGRAEFVAEHPLSLLGLVTMFEARGTDWQARDEEIDSFLSQFP
jgi:hypothetical protein